MDRREEGSTLLEVVVGMSIMSVFLATFTGAIVTLTRTQNRAQALTTSAGQLNTAFQRLDSTIRYAAAISAPGTTGPAGAWYVEYLTTATGKQVCTQLRVDAAARQLQTRTWQLTDTGSTTPTAWVPLASSVTNGSALPSSTGVVPFVLTYRDGGVAFERLTVQLVATTGNPAVTSRSAVTFTALNSPDAAALARASSTAPTTVCPGRRA